MWWILSTCCPSFQPFSRLRTMFSHLSRTVHQIRMSNHVVRQVWQSDLWCCPQPPDTMIDPPSKHTIQISIYMLNTRTNLRPFTIHRLLNWILLCGSIKWLFFKPYKLRSPKEKRNSIELQVYHERLYYQTYEHISHA